MEKQLPWNQRLRYERQKRGWSQEKLAEKIGSNAKTIIRWEKGLHIPTPELKQQLALALETSIEDLGLLTAGQEGPHPRNGSQPLPGQLHEDWGDAPRLQEIYGRETELTLAERWIREENGRTLAILGIGGIGKTTLAVTLTARIKGSFEVLFWRSLKDAPPLKTILEECIAFLARQQPDLVRPEPQASEEQLLSLLITALRQQRCLFILDNFEAVMQQQKLTGQYRQSYAGYGEFIRRVSELEHNSCFLLTSREKPVELLHLEGSQFVHTLHLSGLNASAGKQMLAAERLHGIDVDGISLVQRFSGNPLALKLIAEPIRELFSSEITTFLEEGEVVFGNVQALLEQQFERLSALEQEMLYFLAIEREAITSQGLQRDLAHFVSRGKIIEALESLRRRSLIETGSSVGSFTIQPVIMEYVTERCIERVCGEMTAEVGDEAAGSATKDLPWHLTSLPMLKAETKDYIRKSQMLLIIEPIVNRICATYGEQFLLTRLRELLHKLHVHHPQHPGYLAGNILNLLITMQVDLQGFDFSQLCIRQVDLRGVALPGVNFARANLSTSIFKDTFSTIYCVAFSPDGSLLAAGTASGEIRLWLARDTALFLTCRGHSDWVRSVAFSPDGKLLASGSEDQTLRIWDTSDGRCLLVLEGHTGPIRSVAFSPDGESLVSGGEDRSIRLWKTKNGSRLSVLSGHSGWIRSVTFSPDGSLLASSSDDQTVRLWKRASGQCLAILQGHSERVRSVAFNADGTALVSASDDLTVRIWDVQSGQGISILRGHRHRVRAACFNQAGDLVASGSEDSTTLLWNAHTGKLLFTLRGHVNRISSVVFSPDNQTLVTAGEDQTIRFWEVQTGRCIKTLHGYTSLFKSLAFSPDGQWLAGSGDDRIIRIWNIATSICEHQMHGHAHRVRTISYSPDGQILASGSEDYTIRLWQSHSGQCIRTLQGHTHLIRSVRFNGDGSLLASASYDQTIRLWDVQDGHCRAVLQGHNAVIWSIAFDAESETLVSCGRDQEIRVWDIRTGKCIEVLKGPVQRVRGICIQPGTNVIITGSSDDQAVCLWNVRSAETTWLRGHSGWVRALDFQKNGTMVASGSQDQTLRLWNGENGQCANVLRNGSEVSSVAFSPDSEIVAGGGNNGAINLWSTQTGQHLSVLRSERPYEGMNIAGIRGISQAQQEALLALGAVERA